MRGRNMLRWLDGPNTNLQHLEILPKGAPLTLWALTSAPHTHTCLLRHRHRLSCLLASLGVAFDFGPVKAVPIFEKSSTNQ